jgi:putative transposase
MPRTARNTPGGLIYHAINRAGARLRLFSKVSDYDAFEQLLDEALAKRPVRLLAYCAMPTHWHMVVWPRKDDDLSEFLGWLTHTHSMRWHSQHHAAGTGHLYQGRFKAFPIQADEHVHAVVRYVESNPLRAKLVKRAEDWRWSSLWRRRESDWESRAALAAWPVPEPAGWLRLVNKPLTPAELELARRSVIRGCPFGSELWVLRTARKLGLESSMRPRGRPRKTPVMPEKDA